MDPVMIHKNQADIIASHFFKQDLYKCPYSKIIILACFVLFTHVLILYVYIY
jgi:hypothetical protein